MTKFYGFEIGKGRIYTFFSVSSLKRWLEDENWNCGNPEAFTEWLEKFFDDGNEISVRGEHYSYLDCLELI